MVKLRIMVSVSPIERSAIAVTERPVALPPQAQGAAVMNQVLRQIEIMERCAAECLLISQLAIDPKAQSENEELANEYQVIVDRLEDSDLFSARRLGSPLIAPAA
jgi:hypothetical protein